MSAGLADGQAMHDPILLPDGGRDVAEQRVLAQPIPKLRPEEHGKRLDRRQKLGRANASLSGRCPAPPGTEQ